MATVGNEGAIGTALQWLFGDVASVSWTDAQEAVRRAGTDVEALSAAGLRALAAGKLSSVTGQKIDGVAVRWQLFQKEWSLTPWNVYYTALSISVRARQIAVELAGQTSEAPSVDVPPMPDRVWSLGTCLVLGALGLGVVLLAWSPAATGIIAAVKG